MNRRQSQLWMDCYSLYRYTVQSSYSARPSSSKLRKSSALLSPSSSDMILCRYSWLWRIWSSAPFSAFVMLVTVKLFFTNSDFVFMCSTASMTFCLLAGLSRSTTWSRSFSLAAESRINYVQLVFMQAFTGKVDAQVEGLQFRGARSRDYSSHCVRTGKFTKDGLCLVCSEAVEDTQRPTALGVLFIYFLDPPDHERLVH